MPKKVTRLDLCRELLELRAKYADPIDRMDAIKSELKSIAEKDGSFRETVANLGYITGSPPSAAKFKGDFPVVNAEAWKALKPSRQNKLLEDGVIKIEALYSNPYYGRIAIKLF